MHLTMLCIDSSSHPWGHDLRLNAISWTNIKSNNVDKMLLIQCIRYTNHRCKESGFLNWQL